LGYYITIDMRIVPCMIGAHQSAEEKMMESSAPVSSESSWVRAWYAAPVAMPALNFTGRTLRQIIYLQVGGSKIRLCLSNRYGTNPVTLDTVFVGKASPTPLGPIVLPGAQPALFGGQTQVTLPIGEDIQSDPIALHVDAFEQLAISFFVTEGDLQTGHMFANQTSSLSGPGNVSQATGIEASFAFPLQTTSWWGVTGLDIVPEAGSLRAVVALGSSVTDGVGSTMNTNRRWPDVLAHRLASEGPSRFMSVINAGIGGNRLLPASSLPGAQIGVAIPMDPRLFGESGLDRFEWDVLAQPGVTDLILHIASNDLRLGATAESIIDGFQHVAARAHQHGLRVYGTTILPGGYTPEQARHFFAANEWIHQHGASWFDAVFDFYTPLRHPTDPTLLDPACDSGDGIHPNDLGYQRMAEAVVLDALAGSAG
jgi:lysophospholipase L1-like esterase